MSDDPKPTPQPIDWSKWATPIAVIGLGVMMLIGRAPTPAPGPAPTPPAPVVVPTKFTYERTSVLVDGIALPPEEAKPIIDAVNVGSKSYLVRYTPFGQKEENRTVVVSGGVVPPKPDPPGPNPPPVPPIPPDPTGPLTILLVRESADSTPEMAMLIRDLRTGPVADYLKSKQHALGVLDTNAKDKDGNPSPAIEEWRQHFAGLTLPVLVVYDPTTKRVLSKQTITPATTANQIMQTIKENGG